MSKSRLRKIKFANYNNLREVVYVTGLTKVLKELEILKDIQHQNVIQFHEVLFHCSLYFIT